MPAETLTQTRHTAHDRAAAGRRWIGVVEAFGADQDLWRLPSWKRAAANNASGAHGPHMAQRGRRMRASAASRRSSS
ncbi:MAG: hypothetical protein AAGK04_03335 [Planctomycetota bacterium]